MGPTLNPNFVPFWDKEEKTIPQMLQEVVDVMCDKYCKWPDEWNEEAKGMELSESDICLNCPLNRLT